MITTTTQNECPECSSSFVFFQKSHQPIDGKTSQITKQETHYAGSVLVVAGALIVGLAVAADKYFSQKVDPQMGQMMKTLNMSTERKEFHLAKRILQLTIVGLISLGAGIVGGQSQQARSPHVLSKKRETVNSIPKEYGRLAGVERSSEGTVLYFEAPDGTIRFVSVIYGIDYGSLSFKAVTVPRN